MALVKFIGDRTEYELKIGHSESAWSCAGKNPLELEDKAIFGGYGQGAEAICEACVEFIKWFNDFSSMELNELYQLTTFEQEGELTASQKERYIELVEFCRNNKVEIPFGIEY